MPTQPGSRRNVKSAISPGGGGDLLFIHSSHPDEVRTQDVQTEIRRHVMRDIGRSRRRRPRQVVVTIDVPAGGIPTEGVESSAPESDGPSEQQTTFNVSESYLSWLQAWRSNAPTPSRPRPWLRPLGQFPVEPNTRTLELVHFSTSAYGLLRRSPFR